MNPTSTPTKAQLPKGLEMSMEKDSEEEISYDFRPQYTKPKRERSSNYRESVQDIKNRCNRTYDYKREEKEEEKSDDSFNRLIWGGYHKIIDQNDTRDSHKNEEEDDEAMVIETSEKGRSAGINSYEFDPISYLQKGVMRRKKIARLSKSIRENKRFY